MIAEPLFKSGWEVTAVRDGESFLRSLVDLLPIPSYLVLEGSMMAPTVKDLLESAAVRPRARIRNGTDFPSSPMYHVVATAALLAELGDRAARRPESQVCDHLHAYDDNGGLLHWYDAFYLPLLVSSAIGEDSLRKMCEACGATYKRWQHTER